ncbi:MAG: hypothetical protein ACK55E_07485, partial [Cyanobacteriota bacterium]
PPDLYPLGALTAWSHRSAATGGPDLQNAQHIPGGCPALELALERLWRSPTARPPTPARPPSDER